jgi:hypothetical protein
MAFFVPMDLVLAEHHVVVRLGMVKRAWEGAYEMEAISLGNVTDSLKKGCTVVDDSNRRDRSEQRLLES